MAAPRAAFLLLPLLLYTLLLNGHTKLRTGPGAGRISVKSDLRDRRAVGNRTRAVGRPRTGAAKKPRTKPKPAGFELPLKPRLKPPLKPFNSPETPAEQWLSSDSKETPSIRFRRLVEQVAPMSPSEFGGKRFDKIHASDLPSRSHATIRVFFGERSYLLEREHIDFTQSKLKGMRRLFKRSQKLIDMIAFFRRFGHALTHSVKLNYSWTQEIGPRRFAVCSLWEYCNEGSLVDYLGATHGVSVITNRRAYISFHTPERLPLALQISLVEVLRQLTVGSLEFTSVGAICADVGPYNIMVKGERDRYRFLMFAQRPKTLDDPSFVKFPGKQYVCRAAYQALISSEPRLRPLIAEQFQYFHLVWSILSCTGVSDELQDMLRDIDIYTGEETRGLAVNITTAGVRFVPSYARKKMKAMISDHLSTKGAEALGVLFNELLSFPKPSSKTIKRLLMLRKSLLGLYQFSIKAKAMPPGTQKGTREQIRTFHLNLALVAKLQGIWTRIRSNGKKELLNVQRFVVHQQGQGGMQTHAISVNMSGAFLGEWKINNITNDEAFWARSVANKLSNKTVTWHRPQYITELQPPRHSEPSSRRVGSKSRPEGGAGDSSGMWSPAANAVSPHTTPKSNHNNENAHNLLENSHSHNDISHTHPGHHGNTHEITPNHNSHELTHSHNENHDNANDDHHEGSRGKKLSDINHNPKAIKYPRPARPNSTSTSTAEFNPDSRNKMQASGGDIEGEKNGVLGRQTGRLGEGEGWEVGLEKPGGGGGGDGEMVLV